MKSKSKSIYPTWRQANEIRKKTLRALRRQGRRMPPLRIYREGDGWAITSRRQIKRTRLEPYHRQRFDWNWAIN